MTGITAYGAYVPYHRITRGEIAGAYGKATQKGERAVAYYDEDSITMAVAAAINAGADQKQDELKAVFFASTTAPYKEKQGASQIAAALDAPFEMRTSDFGSTLRVATNAMLAANELAEKSAKTLVAISDCRLGAADGQNEMELGDGAAAFIFGDTDVLAKVVASHSISKDFLDVWRADDDEFIRDWDVRYANTQLYIPAVSSAVKETLKKAGLTPGDISKVALYSHKERYGNEVLKKLGFAPEQVQPTLYDKIGNTGSAAAPIMLAAALDEAKPGDRILFATYGEGCDCILFEVTEQIGNFRPVRTVSAQIARKDNTVPYGKFLKWKALIDCEPQKRPALERSALPHYYRNYKKNNALYGSKCTACGRPVFPAQRICVYCKAIDHMEPYRFYGKKATVRTFTRDGLSISLDSPNNLVIASFEGGGKITTFIDDCHGEDLYVGMPVQPTFRKMFKENGVSTYFWKLAPAAETEDE